MSSDGGGCLPRFDSDGRVAGMDVGRPGALAHGHAAGAAARAGVRSSRCCRAFTSNVAELLRLAGKGRLGVGADADLVVLEADNAVQHVMARGRWHRFDGRPRIQGPFEKEDS